MIKFFQKLKAKKGFTLVELIVVIAIIGVLAAILIPTMLGYVTSSRVTSADTTAANLQKNIDAFLTNADTAGYGMKRANTNVETMTIEVTETNGWVIKMSDYSDFKAGNGVTWADGTGMKANAAMSSAGGKATNILALELANLFPDLKTAYIEASLVAGHCAAIFYTADASAVTDLGDLHGNISSNGGWTETVLAWDGSTAGVSSNGLIVGTAPKLALKTATT